MLLLCLLVSSIITSQVPVSLTVCLSVCLCLSLFSFSFSSPTPLSPQTFTCCTQYLQKIHNLSLSHRLAAYEEIKRACHISNANCQLIALSKLDFDELNAADAFYAADVAIVDLSIQNQQHSLFYRIGNRENFGMRHNILIYNDDSLKVTIPRNLPISNFNLISYRLSPTDKKCYVTEPVVGIKPELSTNRPLSSETKILLSTKLRNSLQDVQIQTK